MLSLISYSDRLGNVSDSELLILILRFWSWAFDSDSELVIPIQRTDSELLILILKFIFWGFDFDSEILILSFWFQFRYPDSISFMALMVLFALLCFSMDGWNAVSNRYSLRHKRAALLTGSILFFRSIEPSAHLCWSLIQAEVIADNRIFDSKYLFNNFNSN